MLILRKIIVREWFRFFVGSFLVLFLLLTVANLISGLLRTNVTPTEVFFNYLIELPISLGQILPISCLIATLFSINRLKARNELTAIFAAGLSRQKFILSLLYCSIIVGVIQLLNASYLQSYVRENRHRLIKNYAHKFRNLKKKGLSASTISSGKIWYKSGNYYFSFSTFDRKTEILHDVSLYYFNKDYLLTHLIKGKKLVYKKGGHWQLIDGSEYVSLHSDRFQKSRPATTKKIILNETLESFKKIDADITTLNINGLYRYIKQLANSGINTNEYMVIFLNKVSSSILCVVFAFIPIAGIFNPGRRNSSFGKAIFGVFIFTLLYWLINSYFTQLGKSSKISPYLATFTVPLLFSVLIAYQLIRHRKLT